MEQIENQVREHFFNKNVEEENNSEEDTILPSGE